MTTDLVLAAIDQAIFTRKRDGVKSLAGLIHHNDAGSQYTSVRFTDRLIAEGINPSIGTVGDAHDNSLAESINGLYKTELIKPRRPRPGNQCRWKPSPPLRGRPVSLRVFDSPADRQVAPLWIQWA